jgi:uncharacterized protein (TIGR03435 family)
MLGPSPAPVRAGDPAPPLAFSKIVRAGLGFGGPQSLSGQVTVLFFLRPVSHNEHAVAQWNKMVEQFAGKPVNFVWIANEKEETLEPFLKTHPVSGWMILDPQDESFKAYGIEGGGGVLIDPRGVIAGFTFMAPDARQIQAVLDGHAVAIQGDPTEEQMEAFFEGNLVRIDAEPHRSPPPQKPDLPPPSEEVHISPSQTHGTIGSSGPDHWIQRGFDLKTIVATISRTDPSRVDLPESFDARVRYDFVLVPPREEDIETMYRRVREGIEKYFHVAISKQIRSKDVYVMTAIEGKTPPPKPPAKPETDEDGWTTLSPRLVAASGFTRTIAVPHGAPPTRKALEDAAKQLADEDELPDMASISASNTSMDHFRTALEGGLKRPIVDETKLSGTYDLAVKGRAQTVEEFLGMLRDQLGLLLTPTQRGIEIVAVAQLPATR